MERQQRSILDRLRTNGSHTVTFGALIDILVGFVFVLPHLASNATGFYPLFLTVVAVISASLASLMVAGAQNSSISTYWFRARNLFWAGSFLIYVLPVIAMYRAFSTFQALGANTGALLFSVHLPVFMVFGNMMLSYFMRGAISRARQSGRRLEEIELLESSMFAKGDGPGKGGKGGQGQGGAGAF